MDIKELYNICLLYTSIYLLLFAITFLVEAVLHLEALSVGLVLENLKIYFPVSYTHLFGKVPGTLI